MSVPNETIDEGQYPAINKGTLTKISFEEYAKLVAPYTLEEASKLSKVPKENFLKLAKAYADPNKKVASYWTMGFNQHTRGVWVNGLCYNVHLLMGKISEPGNNPTQTSIDCHKGIAHSLPEGFDPAWNAPGEG